MVPGQDELRSLDELAEYKEDTAGRGMWAGDRDRLPPARIRSQAALKREEAMRQETRRRARERSAAFEPDGLNVALQPFVTGELPIEELGRRHLEGYHELPEGRPGNLELIYIRRALRFRPAAELFRGWRVTARRIPAICSPSSRGSTIPSCDVRRFTK
jgi:hypothetical protein